jgi:hypothetical protein
MALDRDSRAEEELKLILRTQFNYKLARERIRFKYDVLKPEVDKLRAGKSVLGMPEGHAFEVRVRELDHRDSPDPKADDSQ